MARELLHFSSETFLGMRTIEKHIRKIIENHHFEVLPNGQKCAEKLDGFPEDLILFFESFDGVCLFEKDQFSCKYSFPRNVHLEAAKDKFDCLDSSYDNYLAVCEHIDGSWSCIGRSGRIVEICFDDLLCGHEPTIVSQSFTDFLGAALESENKLFWL